MNSRLFFCAFFTCLLLFSCEPGEDYYYRGTGPSGDYRPVGRFELTPTYSNLGCPNDFIYFLEDYYGYILQPRVEVADIIESGYDGIDIWFEDTDLYVIAYPDSYDSFTYTGRFTGDAVVEGCYISETLDVILEDTGYEIYLTVYNDFYNSTGGYYSYCPFYEGLCTNTIDFVGEPLF